MLLVIVNKGPTDYLKDN